MPLVLVIHVLPEFLAFICFGNVISATLFCVSSVAFPRITQFPCNWRFHYQKWATLTTCSAQLTEHHVFVLLEPYTRFMGVSLLEGTHLGLV